MKTTVKLAAAASLLALAACGQQEEEVMVQPQPQTTPIYAKDGTIVGQRPVVVNNNGMSDDGMTSTGDERTVGGNTLDDVNQGEFDDEED